MAHGPARPPGVKHFFPEPEDEAERRVWGRVASWSGPEITTPESVRKIAASADCDLATALLHQHIVESEQHGPFLRRLNERGAAEWSAGLRVAIVPGAFYRENPRTGADGRVVRGVAEQLGLPVVVVPIASTGLLAENAQHIAAWLRAQDGPLILVSVSKGGSDLKMALARPDADEVFARVRGWINICGILEGTPMADWLLSPSLMARANRFVQRIRGRSLDFLDDLRRPGKLDFPLSLPLHLRVAHVVGFPLRRHLRNGLARRCHARLEPWGPNDGAILLADALRWPGQVCPVWGADHYLRSRHDERPLLAALLREFATPAESSAAR
jgi:hypothetical protein